MFTLNERVLCYEPDPNKIRVIYDAKILQVRPPGQFLVHFQGWNSSWDRFVPEDHLLKDNEDNRELQHQLFEQAEEAKKTNKLKKKRKRQSASTSLSPSALASSSEGGDEDNEDIVVHLSEDDDASPSAGRAATSSSAATSPPQLPEKTHAKEEGDEENLEPPEKDEPAAKKSPPPPPPLPSLPAEVVTAEEPLSLVPVPLSDVLKRRLEQDLLRVRDRGQLARLPSAKYTVVSALESFVRHYAAAKLRQHERQHGASSPLVTFKKEAWRDKFRRVQDGISLCKEFAEGMRVLFDFHLDSAPLLYKNERDQFRALVGGERIPDVLPNFRLGLPSLSETRATATFEPSAVGGSVGTGSASGRSTPTRTTTTSSTGQLLNEVEEWRLVPSHVRPETMPSLIYGPTYLLRMYVKMPAILAGLQMPTKKCKVILQYLQQLLDFLDKSEEFFEQEEDMEVTEGSGSAKKQKSPSG